MENHWVGKAWARGLRHAARALAVCVAAAAMMGVAQAKGIGFAYAPEQGMGVCVGDSIDALNCARQQCVASSGALPQDCARVAWCYPAGWSVAVAYMGQESHWSEFSCGWPSREGALVGGKTLCELSMQVSPWISECLISTVWDPEGREFDVPEAGQ